MSVSPRTVPRLLSAALVAVVAVVVACSTGAPTTREPATVAPTATSSPVSARSDRRGELQIRGRVKEVSLAPDGRIWLTDAFGNSYSADRIDGDWSHGPLRQADTSMFSLSVNEGIDRLTFFDERTAIASGYLLDYGNRERDPNDRGRTYVLRTEDGGVTWDSVFVGPGFWVYDVFVRGGDVWLGGSSGVLHHSSDRGATWRAIETGFDGSSRLSSIFMASRDTGWIGALDDAIAFTTDGGRSWRSLPTPLGQGLLSRPEEDRGDDRIDRMIRFGRWLVARENYRIFRTPLDRIAWDSIPGGDLLDVVLDRENDRLVGVREDLRVVAFDTAWRATEIGGRPLPSRPIHIAVRDGVVYALDEGHGLAAVGRDSLVFSYPLTSAEPTPTVYTARRRGDLLVGATQFHVYESDDEGKTWYRIGITHSPIQGVLPLADEEHLVWDRHGANLLLDRRTGATRPVPGLVGDLAGIVTHPTGWIAFGGMHYQTTFRVEVAQTFFGGQFRGSRPSGFVALSTDSGRTWREVDQWPNEGVAYVHVRPDGDLVLLSWVGSIRVLERSDAGAATTYAGRTVLTADTTNTEEVPYVQAPHAVYFENDSAGWIGGWIHHIGNRHFHTTDGGRSWNRVSEHRFPYAGLVPTRAGWVGHTGRALYLLEGAGRREITVPGLGDTAGGITDISVDDRGRILVEVNASEYGDPRDPRKRWITVEVP